MFASVTCLIFDAYLYNTLAVQMDSDYLWVFGLNLAYIVQSETDSLPNSTGLLALLAKQTLIAESFNTGPRPFWLRQVN